MSSLRGGSVATLSRRIATFVVASSLIVAGCSEVGVPIGPEPGLDHAAVPIASSVSVEVPVETTPVTIADAAAMTTARTSRVSANLDRFCGPAPEASQTADDDPVRVIYDTDFGPDVDDVGALAVLHALADAGEAEILGVMLSNVGDDAAFQAVDVVNTFYGRPDLPIGIQMGPAPTYPSRYTAGIAAAFEHDVDAPVDAVSLYREILAGQPDGSVKIVSVGFLGNLADLVTSEPDEHSDMTGTELVATKVDTWVAMGGHNPDSVDHPSGREFNFARDKQAAIVAVATWPTPVVFSGYEIGSRIETGAVLATETPLNNPVREAYRLYTGGDNRASYDLTAALYAVRGVAGLFDVCTGENWVDADGSNVWQLSASGDHRYLQMVVSPQEIADVLDELLVKPPRATASG